MRRRHDDGAVLIVVAVFSAVALVFLAIVIDLGDLRQEKKEVTLSTDAAALAAAALIDTADPSFTTMLLTSDRDCAGVNAATNDNPDAHATLQDAVDAYLAVNGGSNPLACTVHRTGIGQGYVVVSADETVDYQLPLASASGVVDGISVAAFEPSPGGGLRPMGICNVTDTLSGPSMVALIAESGGGNPFITLNGGAGHLVRFPLEKLDGAQDCGSAAGNFGKLDLDGGNNSDSCSHSNGFCAQLRDGYHGPVVPPVFGSPGNAFNSGARSAMNDLRVAGIRFWVPVYGNVTGNGANAVFTLSHYMEVSFEDHCLGGACRETVDGERFRWFEWQVYRFVPYSVTGPPVTADAGLAPPRLCAVTDEAAAVAANCFGPPLIPVPPPVTVTTTTTITIP